jgi:septal ring factor EnvC (AmiA/AmiB activator)
MIADRPRAPALLESAPVFQRFPPKLSWPLITVSGGLLLVVLALLAAYLPATQHIARLETELRQLYLREAQLQTKLAQQERRQTVSDQQIAALAAERTALTRRLHELEQELTGTKALPPPRRR